MVIFVVQCGVQCISPCFFHHNGLNFSIGGLYFHVGVVACPRQLFASGIVGQNLRHCFQSRVDVVAGVGVESSGVVNLYALCGYAHFHLNRSLQSRTAVAIVYDGGNGGRSYLKGNARVVGIYLNHRGVRRGVPNLFGMVCRLDDEGIVQLASQFVVIAWCYSYRFLPWPYLNGGYQCLCPADVHLECTGNGSMRHVACSQVVGVV